MNAYSPNPASLKTKKRYLTFRILVLFALALVLVFCPDSVRTAMPGGFTDGFSPLHLFWGMWMAYLITKILPWRIFHNRSEFRQFAASFAARIPYPKVEVIKKHVRKANIQAVKSAVAWLVLTGLIGVMRKLHVIHERGLVLLTGIFYVCDLICVIFYCPFQHLLMKNSCCNTCRIHNWDAIMMFTPMAFTEGFFGLSLFSLAAVVFLLWEIRFFRHPERFFAITNANLGCASCPDHHCKIINRL